MSSPWNPWLADDEWYNTENRIAYDVQQANPIHCRTQESPRAASNSRGRDESPDQEGSA